MISPSHVGNAFMPPAHLRSANGGTQVCGEAGIRVSTFTVCSESRKTLDDITFSLVLELPCSLQFPPIPQKVGTLLTRFCACELCE